MQREAGLAKRRYALEVDRTASSISKTLKRPAKVDEIEAELEQLINIERNTAERLRSLDEKTAGFWEEYEAEKERTLASIHASEESVRDHQRRILSGINVLREAMEEYRKFFVNKAWRAKYSEYTRYREALNGSLMAMMDSREINRRELNEIKSGLEDVQIKTAIRKGGYPNFKANARQEVCRLFCAELDKMKDNLGKMNPAYEYKITRQTDPCSLLLKKIDCNKSWIEKSFIGDADMHITDVAKGKKAVAALMRKIFLCRSAEHRCLTKLARLNEQLCNCLPLTRPSVPASTEEERKVLFKKFFNLISWQESIIKKRTGALLADIRIISDIVRG